MEPAPCNSLVFFFCLFVMEHYLLISSEFTKGFFMVCKFFKLMQGTENRDDFTSHKHRKSSLWLCFTGYIHKVVTPRITPLYPETWPPWGSTHTTRSLSISLFHLLAGLPVAVSLARGNMKKALVYRWGYVTRRERRGKAEYLLPPSGFLPQGLRWRLGLDKVKCSSHITLGFMHLSPGLLSL